MKHIILSFAYSTIIFSCIAQVGIGTNSPNASAQLDVTSTNKGFLPPRVVLTGRTDAATIASPATGLLVYNTADNGTAPNNVTAGFYYNAGTQQSPNWVRLIISNEAVQSVGSISNTPDSKGASITSGVLSLTAADATNGGVVTTLTQTFSGAKTFSSDIIVNGVRMGRGAGNNEHNVAIGANALASGTGTRNTAVGYGAMRQYSGTSFDNNTSVGYWNMPSLTIGNGNTSVGAESMLNLSSGTQNTSIGNQSLINTTGSENVGVGKSSGAANTTGSQNTFIGTNTNAGANNLSNATALGYGASVAANNSIQLGNTNVTNVNTSGTITANGFVKSGGTSAQFLKADGSIDATTYQSSNTNLTSIANLANGAGFLKNNGSGTLSYINPSVSEVTGMGTNVATFLATPSSANFAAATTDETGSGALVFATSPSLTTPSLGVATATSINSLTIGRGAANLGGNIVLGESVLSSNTTGQNNTAIGYEAMKLNTLGWSNTALGQSALNKNLSGNNSVAIGYQALFNNTASDNDALGYQAMYSNAGGTRNVSIGQKSLNKNTLGNNNTVLGFTALPEKSTGSDNIAIGYYAGRTTADGTTLLTEINNSILIGADTRANANNETNQIVIGHGAIGAGSNTIRLGNTSITAVNTSGTITANGFVKSGGTSSQFLMANGTATSSPSLSGATGLPLNTGVSGTLPVANGGTGATDAASARTNLGATTVGSNFFTLSNPSQVRFPRINEDNTVSALLAADFRTAIGAQRDLTNPITGTGTSNYIPKFDQTNSLVNSGIFDNSGKIGIGTNSPSTALHIQNGNIIGSGSPESNELPSIYVYNNNNSSTSAHSIMAIRTAGANSGNPFLSFDILGIKGFSVGMDNADADKLKFHSNWNFNNSSAPIMTLTTDNKVGIGTASPTAPFEVTTSESVAIKVVSTNSDNAGILTLNANTNDNFTSGNNDWHEFITFQKQGTVIGRVTNNGANNISYSTSSDYRLKEDFKNFNGLNLINKMKVYDYAWITDKSRMFGFKAHEIQELLPYLVSGKKDEIDAEGKPKYQMVDYSKLTPVLVKAVQEQQELISKQNERIEKLEKIIQQLINQKD